MNRWLATAGSLELSLARGAVTRGLFGEEAGGTPGDERHGGQGQERRSRMASEMIGGPDELVAVVPAFMPGMGLGGDARQHADQDDDPEAEHR